MFKLSIENTETKRMSFQCLDQSHSCIITVDHTHILLLQKIRKLPHCSHPMITTDEEAVNLLMKLTYFSE